eukprot:TRINITY_DN58778_c0_g1_i1.p1 TRINITY_DN58778_c0_g1~~TRINITY_DN58778_c0_g1_i1.p1  ORF type:complete len:112 (+),score=16.66 TRINITY_DN58778_c0_g1_i1:65-400(+)
MVGGRLGTAVNTPSNDCPGASYPRHKCPRPVASMLCLRVAACPKERDCLSTTHTITVVNSLVSSFNNQLMWMLVLLTTLTTVSYTHLRAHETPEHLVCRLLLEKKKKNEYK